MKKIIVSLITCLAFLNLSLAHSGRTDANGGHNDNINGGYHYHHGMGAHQHPNGICANEPRRDTAYKAWFDQPSNTRISVEKGYYKEQRAKHEKRMDELNSNSSEIIFYLAIVLVVLIIWYNKK